MNIDVRSKLAAEVAISRITSLADSFDLLSISRSFTPQFAFLDVKDVINDQALTDTAVLAVCLNSYSACLVTVSGLLSGNSK